MNKKYIIPTIHLFKSSMKHAVLQHSETPGDEEGDEFNARKREEFETEEEDYFLEEENPEKGLW